MADILRQVIGGPASFRHQVGELFFQIGSEMYFHCAWDAFLAEFLPFFQHRGLRLSGAISSSPSFLSLSACKLFFGRCIREFT